MRLPALLLLLSLSACATADDPAAPSAQTTDPSAEHVVVRPQAPDLAPDTGAQDVCACADDDCVADWVATNLGCDVSALIVCGDERTLEAHAPCAALE